MTAFVPWDSQPFDVWAARHAAGRFIDLDGQRTHYLERGEGAPLILLHGFMYDSYLWAENLDALARHFKVYALDLWGWGYSTREPLDYGYELYARQLRLFMDALGIARASLMGQSMGAGTAIRFCVDHRERVDKLVLVAAAGLPNRIPRSAKILDALGLGRFVLSLKTNAVRRQALADSFIHDRKLLTDDYVENVTRSQKIEGSMAVGMTTLRKEFFDKLSGEIERLAAMSVPALIVWGRQDKAIPVARAEDLHRILKGSRLEILDPAGHVPNFEQAAQFNRLAIEFLSA